MLGIIWDCMLLFIAWADLGFWGWLTMALVMLGLIGSMVDSICWFNHKLKD